jgi:hypothetical protein
MKQPLLIALSLLCCIVIPGCGQQEPPAPATQAAKPASTEEAAQAPRQAHQRNRPSADDIQQIKASGRTGLWADPGEACATGPRQRTVLTWNVASSGASKVIVYLVDKAGKERNFGQGGPVGRRETGPWLRPGTIFRIRNADGKSELGSVTIAEKQC